MKKRFIYASVLVLAIFTIAEVGLRMSGVNDFPVYQTDSSIGYVPAPNQAGAFLNENRWVINDRGMNIADDFSPFGANDLLLTGDSLVWGGNPLDQPQKLGAQLQERLPGKKVWPISAGSWSVENVVVWCDRNQDVVKETDTLVWVLNSGDFHAASEWKSDSTHPRQHPWSSVVATTQKVIMPKVRKLFSNPAGDDATQQPLINVASKAKFREQVEVFKNLGANVLIVLYPNRSEFSEVADSLDQYESFRRELTDAISDEITFLELKQDSRWNPDLYRDSIHPSGEGNRVLAAIISDRLNK